MTCIAGDAADTGTLGTPQLLPLPLPLSLSLSLSLSLLLPLPLSLPLSLFETTDVTRSDGLVTR